jgi:hypothetical protein
MFAIAFTGGFRPRSVTPSSGWSHPAWRHLSRATRPTLAAVHPFVNAFTQIAGARQHPDTARRIRAAACRRGDSSVESPQLSQPQGDRPVPATDPGSIELRLFELELEHRDLDEVVRRLTDQPGIDELLLKRMKKRKLQMKDQIERLRSSLIPDLDA